MGKFLKVLVADTRGVAAVELGLVLGLIAIAVVGSIQGLGISVQSSYTDTAAKVAAATP